MSWGRCKRKPKAAARETKDAADRAFLLIPHTHKYTRIQAHRLDTEFGGVEGLAAKIDANVQGM